MEAVALLAEPVRRALYRCVVERGEVGRDEAARALGAGNGRILLYHILPNVMAPIIVFASLNLSTAILTASTLSFLGLGPQPPTSEWGAMVSSSRGYLRVAPHLMLFPTLAIFITVLAFNFVGEGLRDALDPRLRGT